MTRFDLMLTALALWSVLLALAAVQLVAELRWRRRCARRDRPAEVAEKP